MATAAGKSVILKDIPFDLHRAAKIRAAQEETTLKALILKALEEYLARHEEWNRERDAGESRW